MDTGIHTSYILIFVPPPSTPWASVYRAIEAAKFTANLHSKGESMSEGGKGREKEKERGRKNERERKKREKKCKKARKSDSAKVIQTDG